MTLPASLFISPPDDAGAETADRYDWQALTAAVDCLACLVGNPAAGQSIRSDICVICEHHEDYIVCVGDVMQLVSAKHRDLSQGSWTYATVFNDGGVAHLFHRWAAFSESLTARMVTNAGLNPEAAKLQMLCEELRGIPCGPLLETCCNALAEAAKRIFDALPRAQIDAAWHQSGIPNDHFVGSARRFLAMLSLDTERPPRQMLPSAAISMYVSPFLESIGRHESLAKSAWHGLCDLFRQRMRGRHDPEREALTEVIHQIHSLSGDERLRYRLHERAIWAKDVIEVIDLVGELGITSLDRDHAVAPTRLALKLLNSGCQATTVHAAESAAQRWRSQESSLALDGAGVGPNLERLKSRALLIASAIHESLAAGTEAGSDYGPRMWAELRAEVTAAKLDDVALVSDDDLALGIVCDLASQCQVWLSPGFDLHEARLAFPQRLGVLNE